MPLLPALAVVFVGITGGDKRVDQQVQLLLQEQEIKITELPPATVRTLARHGEGSRDLVKKLHVDGVVGGELVNDKGHRTLRMVIYDGEGGLKSLFELPVAGRVLSRDDLVVLHSNLEDDVTALVRKARKAADKPAEPKPEPKPEPKIVIAPAPEPPRPVAAPKPEPKPIAAPKPEPKPVAVPAKPAPHTPSPELEFAPEQMRKSDPPADQATHTAEPVDTAEVRPEEMEALVAGSAATTGAVTPASSELHIGAAVGIAITGRNFAPGPATVPGYASTAVGAIHLDAQIQPTTRTKLAVVAERTLQMSSPMAAGSAPTSMSRWEAAGSYTLIHGAIDIAPRIGVGRRSFAIESNDPNRTPDGQYNYLILGATATKALGAHLALVGSVAFEPVVSGAEPTEMAFGEAERWALDVGAAIELRPRAHVFVRGAADYQRFAWSWSARGSSGAVDHYPSGTLSVGAEY